MSLSARSDHLPSKSTSQKDEAFLRRMPNSEPANYALFLYTINPPMRSAPITNANSVIVSITAPFN
jgi:hypothetical protein